MKKLFKIAGIALLSLIGLLLAIFLLDNSPCSEK